jgi:glycosyltransferase involved in cell wall biosynthesis
MACGTPVVYADTSSLTELLGDAGYAVEPDSAESMAEGIRNLLEHPELQKNFIARGIDHVQRYAWENVAHEMLKKIYHKG